MDNVNYIIETGTMTHQYTNDKKITRGEQYTYFEIHKITEIEPGIKTKEFVKKSFNKFKTKDEAIKAAKKWIEKDKKESESHPEKQHINMKKTKTKHYWLNRPDLPEIYEKGEFKELYIVDRGQAIPFKYGILAELKNGNHLLIASAINKKWIYRIKSAINLDFEHIYSNNEIYPECAFKKEETTK